MGTQEEPAPPAVTLADVTAVLDLARAQRGTTAPVPAAWDAVLDQIRAVLAVPAAEPRVPVGGAAGC